MSFLDAFIAAANEYSNMSTANGSNVFSGIGQMFDAERQDVMFFFTELDHQSRMNGMVDFESMEGMELLIQVLEGINVQGKSNTSLGRFYALLMERIDTLRQPVHMVGICPKMCGIDRKYCEECIELRRQAMESIVLINNPTEYRDKFIVSSGQMQRAQASCSFCGAPFEGEEMTCLYCGTKRPGFSAGKIRVNTPGEIPSAVEYAAQSIGASKQFMLAADEEYSYNYQMTFSEVQIRYRCYANNYYADVLQQGLTDLRNGETGRRIREIFDLSRRIMKESEVYMAASELGVPVEVYLRGYMEGSFQNWFVMQADKKNKENDKRAREIQEKNHQLEMEAIDKKAELSKEFWKRQEQLLVSSVPKYNGGSSGGGNMCCGVCALYMPDRRECAKGGSRNATDFCGSFSRK